MPTFRSFFDLLRKLRFALVGLLAAGIAGACPVGPAQAQQDDAFALQFHSFNPAPPSFTFPKLGIWRSNMEKARKAARKGNYKKTRKYLKRALKEGNVTAAWYLGHLYQEGRGVERDDAMAFNYYRKVALTYESDARMNRRFKIVLDSLVQVANVYREGSKSAGVKSQPSRAFKHYSTAASHRHPGGYYGLGASYLKGFGVDKNAKLGLRYLGHAARQRYAPAAALIGDLYWDGDHVRQNRSGAIMWYILATQMSKSAAHPHIYKRLEVMLANVNEGQRAKGQKLASRWNELNPIKATIVPTAN